MGSASPENRPDPDALLVQANSGRRGQLKIFLGAAPGVGKTWEMLAAARRRHESGMDVVVGLVETHGRAETMEQLGELPVLPRRIISYRGRFLEEFDLDAALERRPALLLLDELAHTNAPGLRQAKRWQDVLTLLDAGINVWTTLNVQHLESLNDQVARITGIRVAETLPDTVLGLADDIELIDLPPEELRTRLTQGLVYRPDVARRALNGFFRAGNLAALREMALRRVAQHVDRDIATYMRAQAIAGPWPAAERVMAVVEAGETAEQVVRHAARLAEALRAPFFAFHAEQALTGVAVQPALDLVIQLGGTVETTTNADVLAALLDAAARQNVAHIVIARNRQKWRWRRSLSGRLARAARAYALHVVPDPVASPRAPPRPVARPKLLPFIVSFAVTSLTTVAGFALGRALPSEAMGYVFTAIVVAMASLYGRSVGIFAALTSFVLWNFFFLPPIYTLSVANPRDVTALFAFLVVGVLTGSLAGRVRAEAEAARTRIDALRRITLFGRALAQVSDEAGLATVVEAEARALASEAVLLFARAEGLPRVAAFDDVATAAAEFAWHNRVATGMGTTTLPGSVWRFRPLATEAGVVGVLGVRPVVPLTEPVLQALRALADQAALAAERLRLATRAAEARAQESTQRLRTALLSSLSHDLRTPLTAIRGAAETLAGSDSDLPATTRHDLLASIVQDVGRMTRFLANITGMARIETGEIMARHEPVDLEPLVEQAVSRVPDAFRTAVNIPEDAATVRADPALLEQVLVNLLENAVKYGPEGGAISVFSRREGEHVTLSVADEGVGIPPEDLPHVFDSFFRVVRGDRVAPGTGLGLAIARAFVEAMGGTIRAESPRRDLPADGLPGTVIRVELPLP